MYWRCSSRSCMLSYWTSLARVVCPWAARERDGDQRFGGGPIVQDFGVHEPLIGHDLAVLAVEHDVDAVVGHHGVAPGAADPQVDVDTGHLAELCAPPASDQIGCRQGAVHQVWRSVEGPRDQDLLVRRQRDRRRMASRHCLHAVLPPPVSVRPARYPAPRSAPTTCVRRSSPSHRWA